MKGLFDTTRGFIMATAEMLDEECTAHGWLGAA
jgi:hypothetical protein